MKDSTIKSISAQYEADFGQKMTALKTLSILDGILDDERLSKSDKLYLLSEVENWSKNKQISVLSEKRKN